MTLTEEKIDELRMTAFRTNDPDDRQAYFDAVSEWFQHRDTRSLRAARSASIADTAGAKPVAEVYSAIECDGEWDYRVKKARILAGVSSLNDGDLLYAAPPAPSVADAAVHPDDLAVDEFAQAMKEKLAQAREKGRGGWQECSIGDLSRMLREHVEKGDPRDVANFCMFLWHLKVPILQLEDEPVADAAGAKSWQPITSAQKNSEIWAYNGEQARMKWSEGPDWALWIWADELMSDVDPEPDQPTHWMPLPDAPVAKESGK